MYQYEEWGNISNSSNINEHNSNCCNNYLTRTQLIHLTVINVLDWVARGATTDITQPTNTDDKELDTN